MKISALLLAAGQSKRMLGPNKLLLRLGAESLVHRTAKELLKVTLDQVIVVTGHESVKIETELADLELDIVFNPEYESGMHSSIRAGLSALAKDCDAFFVCLADQPDFDHRILERMIQTLTSAGGAKIIFPSFNGERGQPVLIPALHIPEILAHGDGDHGCNYLFKKYPEGSQGLVLESPAALKDLDTPEDLAAYKHD